MTGFYSLVPFENNIYLIKATESQPLTGEELEKVNKLLEDGNTIPEIQRDLSAIWNS